MPEPLLRRALDILTQRSTDLADVYLAALSMQRGLKRIYSLDGSLRKLGVDILPLTWRGAERASSSQLSAAVVVPDAPDAMVPDVPDQLNERERALLALGGVRWLVAAGIERTCEGAAALLVAAEMHLAGGA